MIVDSIVRIVDVLSPLLVGVLAASASLFGVNLNNKRQDSRALYDNRYKSVSTLFAYINEAERHVIKIELCLKTKQDTYVATQDSIESVRKISEEYDKSAIFFPQSIAQIVESILSTVATVNANLLINSKNASAQEDVASAIKNMKLYKKELREVFQHMIGVRK